MNAQVTWVRGKPSESALLSPNAQANTSHGKLTNARNAVGTSLPTGTKGELSRANRQFRASEALNEAELGQLPGGAFPRVSRRGNQQKPEHSSPSAALAVAWLQRRAGR